MLVNKRNTYRCDHSDECGKPRSARGKKIERRNIKRRERREVMKDLDR